MTAVGQPPLSLLFPGLVCLHIFWGRRFRRCIEVWLGAAPSAPPLLFQTMVLLQCYRCFACTTCNAVDSSHQPAKGRLACLDDKCGAVGEPVCLAMPFDIRKNWLYLRHPVDFSHVTPWIEQQTWLVVYKQSTQDRGVASLGGSSL